VYRRTTAITGAPTVVEYFDSLNRAVLTETTGFHGTGNLVENLYNPLGQVGQVSQPFAAGQTTKYWTSYGHDALGRVIREKSSAIGLTTTITRASPR
jgi:hypothetical protein